MRATFARMVSTVSVMAVVAVAAGGDLASGDTRTARNGIRATTATADAKPQARPAPKNRAAFRAVRSFGPGVNFSTLDAPNEGDFTPPLTRAWFGRADRAGFTTVRLPVRFSNHTTATKPFRVREKFLKRVDFAIRNARRHGMRIIVDMHHYRQLDGDPLDYGERRVDPSVVDRRFVAMWRQIARRYADEPNSVIFELYNEPHNRLTAEKWNRLYRRALKAVRATNPRRFVVVGPTTWNSAYDLRELHLPRHDHRLIVTIHNYDPFTFTHQGAEWVEGADAWLGTRCCSRSQGRELNQPLDVAEKWSQRHRRPIFVGEFGAYARADMAARATYTRIARKAAEAHGFSWMYWEFLGNFGVYNPEREKWRWPLRRALLD
jgi:endoglucanase